MSIVVSTAKQICDNPLNRSKTAFTPAGVSSLSTWPHSIMKSQAISTLSSVGFSKRRVNNYKPRNSLITC